MFAWVSGRLRCMGGKHERAEKHIQRSQDERYVSKCRFCSVPMKRRAKRDWIVISRAEFKAQIAR